MIHEVRNLSTAVSLLHTVFVRRKVLYWILGIETFIVASVIAALSIFVVMEHSNAQDLITKITDTCQVRNQQTDATRAYLTTSVALQEESAQLSAQFLKNAHFALTPQQQATALRIQQEYINALNTYIKAQPVNVNCKYNVDGG